MTSLRALLASNIKKRRKALGISQTVLAEKVGTSTHYIGQIEQCKKFPSSEMLERIAAALEMDSPELFSAEVFTDEAIRIVQDKVQADLDEVSISIKKRITEIKIIKN
ncbi:MAG: helix-turn-helix domain-containing protein [Treponema sp.]|jgi:transcriptional regulator with XRE-family HTH domain|nr:helix-turn-helix domain-containing protein [Treponema sp.]